MLKNKLIKSPYAKSLKGIEALMHKARIQMASGSSIKNNRTVYCISPYKTGTTFLAAAYDQKISTHEPMHLASIVGMEKDFDSFFIKRLNTLNLKLECSGFLSVFIKELSQNEFTKDLDYVCIMRKPSSWINSVVNYWNVLSYLKFDYINELYWKKKAGVDLLRFNEADEAERKSITDHLLKFYFEYLEDTKLLKNCMYVDLKEINTIFPKLDKLLDEKAVINPNKKRTNKEKYYVYENKAADERYSKLVSELMAK